MIIERDDAPDWLKRFTGGIFCSPTTRLETHGVSNWSLAVFFVAAWWQVMALVHQLCHYCQPSFRKFTVFLNFRHLAYIFLCKPVPSKCPQDYSSIFSLPILRPLCKHRRWMLVGIPEHPCHWNPPDCPNLMLTINFRKLSRLYLHV